MPDPSTPDAAKPHMTAGIAALGSGDFTAALALFETALALRLSAPWQGNPPLSWLTAAAAINRADALRELGRLREAIAGYDHTVEIMGHVPLGERPSLHHRLLLALVHRAHCLQVMGAEGSARDLHLIEEISGRFSTSSTPEGRGILALHFSNLARLALDAGRSAEGCVQSRRAVDLLAGETTVSAIKARAIHLRALVSLLDDPSVGSLPDDWIAAASDLIEETLTLARGAGYAEAWLHDLIRCGARIYRACQPHFLGEFVAEWFRASAAADESLARFLDGELLLATAALEKRFLLHPHDDARAAAHLRTLRTIRQARARLSNRLPASA